MSHRNENRQAGQGEDGMEAKDRHTEGGERQRIVLQRPQGEAIEPSRDVMEKIQDQLHKIQMDIQVQQRQQRQAGKSKSDPRPGLSGQGGTSQANFRGSRLVVRSQPPPPQRIVYPYRPPQPSEHGPVGQGRPVPTRLQTSQGRIDPGTTQALSQLSLAEHPTSLPGHDDRPVSGASFQLPRTTKQPPTESLGSLYPHSENTAYKTLYSPFQLAVATSMSATTSVLPSTSSPMWPSSDTDDLHVTAQTLFTPENIQAAIESQRSETGLFSGNESMLAQLETTAQTPECDTAPKKLLLSPGSAWHTPLHFTNKPSTDEPAAVLQIPTRSYIQQEMEIRARKAQEMEARRKAETEGVQLLSQSGHSQRGFVSEDNLREALCAVSAENVTPSPDTFDTGPKSDLGKFRNVLSIDYRPERNQTVSEPGAGATQHRVTQMMQFSGISNISREWMDESPEGREVRLVNQGAKPKNFSTEKKFNPSNEAFFSLFQEDQPRTFKPIIKDKPLCSPTAAIVGGTTPQTNIIRPSVLRPITGASYASQEAESPEGHAFPGAETKPTTFPWDKRSKLQWRDTVCSRCGTQYRWPHLLLCCHRFCFRCMVDMHDTINARIQCPICSSITLLSRVQGPDGLNLDMQLCREMCASGMTPFLCTNNKDDNVAHAFCQTCLHYLCHDCSMDHVNQPSEPHIVGPVTKVVFQTNGDFYPSCTTHSGISVEMFCRSCAALVCKKCIIGQHAGHDICSFDAMETDVRKRVLTINLVYGSMISGYRKQLQALNSLRQHMEEGDKKLRNEIHQTCNGFLETIDSKERIARNLANKAHDEITGVLKNMADEAATYADDYRSFQEMLWRYLDEDNVDEFTVCYPQILERCKRLSSFYARSPLMNPDFKVDLKFEPVYPEFNDVLHEFFKEIRFEHNLSMERLLLPDLRDRVQVFARDLESRLSGRCSAEGRLKEDYLVFLKQQEVGASGQDNHPDFIRVTTPFTASFGQHGRGPFDLAEPSGVFYLHDGTLAVCDAKNHRLSVFRNNGTPVRNIGESVNLSSPPECPTNHVLSGKRGYGKLYFPFRGAQCPQTRNIVVVERHPSLNIQIFSFEGEIIRSFGHSKLSYPRGITVDENGYVLIVESRTMNVFIFNQDGQEIVLNSLSTQLQFPNDIAARDGLIYISDNRSHCVHVFNYNLFCVGSIGNESLTYFPIGVAISGSNHVIITDNHNTFNISVFETDGSFVCGFKSRSKHANCYNVAVHPYRNELAVTTKECKVLVFNFTTNRDLSS